MMLRLSFWIMMLFGSLMVSGQEEMAYYTNPIMPSGADPWVVKHEGWYYYCGGVPGGIGVSRSRHLHQINPPVRVWQPPQKGKWNSSCVWAPELHFWKGKWYIFYAAGYEGPPFIHQKTGVLESVTSDAMGEYVDKGMLFTGDVLGDWDNNRWSIDMTLLEHKGQLYAVWSGWINKEKTDKTKQHLYIAKMENPWTISSGRVKISSPDREYEQGELPLNEGPQILKHGKDVFIVYSCGQSWLDTYKLSYLRLKNPDADLLNPESWTKSEKPVFEGTDKVHGVGHACFTTSPDDKEHYIYYHTKKEKTPGWKRDVRLQKFTFDTSGAPCFGQPLPAGERLPLPSGTILPRKEKPLAELEKNFEHLSGEARPYTYWFWMNGNITKEGITKDLEAMHRIGIGGVFNLEGGTGIPKGPVTYLSQEWSELKAHAIKEAARLDIDYIMHNCPGWSSSGGPWITPEYSMQKLTWSETDITGGVKVDTLLRQPPTELNYYKDVAVIAFPSFGNGKPIPFSDWKQLNNSVFNHTGQISIREYDKEQIISPEDIIDLSKQTDAAGRLHWEAPQGKWTIIRLGHTSTGRRNCAAPDTGVGLECDKFSKKAIQLHFNKMMSLLYPLIKPYINQIQVGLEIDSWEVGMQNWTSGFEDEFRARTGYDILRYLPAMTGKIVGSKELTERFLWDIRRVQADLLADNYYGEFRSLCHQLGLTSYCEPYDRGPMEELQIGSRVDGVMGEFWNGLSAIFQNNLMMRRTTKLASSIAHINGQRVVGAEAFTSEPESGRWQEYPFALKAVGDKAFSEGINRMVIHRYAMQPHPTAAPGMTLGPWGIHFDRTNTWWEPARGWMDYLTRCQTMLQEGLFVADFAYFTGDNIVGYTKVHRKDLVPEPPEGHDYDLINTETLLHKAWMEEGRMRLPDGMSYRVLVLQDHAYITLDLLRKLREMVEEGLIVIGARATQSLGLMSGNPVDEKAFNQLSDELWGNDMGAVVCREVGKGRVFWGMPIESIVKQIGLCADFKVTSNPKSAPIRYIHRRIGDVEAYFVANQRRTSEEILCKFRVKDKIPEFWNPVTGKRSAAMVYKSDGETVYVPVQLDEYGSVFVVFRPGRVGENPVHSISKDGKCLIDVSGMPNGEDKLYPDVQNNFSLSMWVKPESDVMLNTDNPMGYIPHPWTEYYAVYPSCGEKLYGAGHATCGLAIGRNGIAVWENEKGYPVFKMGVEKPISGWSHVCLVYNDGTPSVYVNGEPVASGTQSLHTVHPGLNATTLKEGASYYNGDMTYPVLVQKVLTDKEIRQLAKEGRETRVCDRQLDWMSGKDAHSIIACEDGEYTFTTSDGTKHAVQVKGTGKPVNIGKKWKVRFPSGSGAPEEITMSKLVSLHKSTQEGVRHFSGTATYTTEFKVEPSMLAEDKVLYLDLGSVEVLAEVIVNGVNKGILWSRPYRVEVSDVVKPGNNTLEVKVTNLWTNRLIGDEQLSEENEYVPGGGINGLAALSRGAIKKLPDWYKNGDDKPRGGRVAFTTWQHYRKDSPLVESGLTGPVRLLPGKVVTIDNSPSTTYFPLEHVRLLESPFSDLQQKGKDYLLWLNPDSLLHFYRIEAGLSPKAKAYAGWESQDVWGAGPLRGGFLGFYLSSASMMYQATGDEQLLKRLKYVLGELELCQKAGKDGYLLGVENGRELFREVASGKIKTNNPTVNGAWAPVYLINKMLLGLSAAYTQCGLKNALPMMTRLADWFGRQVLDKLTDEQIQQLLVCEHGSINESYVEAYELTGEARFLQWAGRLHDEDMWVPLSQGKDILFGWHANTQIPKFTGFEKFYQATGDKRFLNAALNFWDIVTRNHTWVIGGNSTGEHFFPKEEFEKRVLLNGGPETCNSVNMLRLTEALFSYRPDAGKAAYYERVLFNHILSAYDPINGMCCYFTSMRPGHYRIYASRDSSFWCCGHTGLESPAKLGKFIYSREKDGIRVNLFIPSVLNFSNQGVELTQRNHIPESDRVEFALNLQKERTLTLRIRKPDWAQNPVLVINGKEEEVATDASGYWILDRKWKRKNSIVLKLPMKPYTERLIGSDKYVALLYGPYVLAGRLGKENLPQSFWSTMNNTARNRIGLEKVPVLKNPAKSIPELLKVMNTNPLHFRLQLDGFEDIDIEPFYKVHFERYAVYWPVGAIEEIKK